MGHTRHYCPLSFCISVIHVCPQCLGWNDEQYGVDTL